MKLSTLTILFILTSCQGSNSLGTSGSGLIETENTNDPIEFEVGEDFNLTIDSNSEFATMTLSNIQQNGDTLEFEGSVILETGRLSLTNTIENGGEQTLNFRNSFDDPIVLLHIMTANDTETVTVRGRNLTGSNISVFLQDPSAGSHGTEEIAYVVVESGEYELGNGVLLEAAHYSSTDNHNASEAYESNNVTLGNSYSSAPNAFSSLNTYTNTAFKSSVISAVSTSSIGLQQSSGDSGTATALEDISYFVMSDFTGDIQGQAFEVKSESGSSDSGFDNGTPAQFSFSSFGSTPDILSDGRTDAGADGYFARGSGLWSSTQYGVYAWEDTIGDSERAHINENFSVFAAEPNSEITKYETTASFISPSYDISNITD